MPGKRTRIRDAELSRAQSAQMLTLKLARWDTARIAKYFNVTPQWVNRRIAQIPKAEKKVIAKEFNRGQIGVG